MAAFKYLILSQINVYEELKSKEYVCTVLPGQDDSAELRRLHEIQLELINDHRALVFAHTDITKVTARWRCSIADYPTSPSDMAEMSKKAHAFLTAFTKEHQPDQIAETIKARAQELESLLETLTDSLDALRTGNTSPQPQPAGSGAADRARDSCLTNAPDDVNTVNLSLSLSDSSTDKQQNPADTKPSYTSSSVSAAAKTQQALMPYVAPPPSDGLARSTSATPMPHSLPQLKELPLQPFDCDALESANHRDHRPRIVESPGRTLEESEQFTYLVQCQQAEPAALIGDDALFRKAVKHVQLDHHHLLSKPFGHEPPGHAAAASLPLPGGPNAFDALGHEPPDDDHPGKILAIKENVAMTNCSSGERLPPDRIDAMIPAMRAAGEIVC